MKVINIFAGPCAGKSTTAAGLFYLMKVSGYNVELVTEYAKDMTWEGRHNILGDQLYILAKQNRRLERRFFKPHRVKIVND
jgi:ATP:corrinoid adenosyltransferase